MIDSIIDITSFVGGSLVSLITNFFVFIEQLGVLISYLPSWLTVYALGFIAICILFLVIDR